MKKAFVFAVLVMVALGSCSNKQKVEGAWTDNEGITWVFNKDGKLIQDGEEATYAITATQLSVSQGGQTAVFDFSISADGKTLLLNSSRYGSRALTKKIYSKPKSGDRTFTLTNIPSTYDGKYAALHGSISESSSILLGGKKIIVNDFDSWAFDVTASRISNGKVILPMWIINSDGSINRYKPSHIPGDHTNLNIVLFIYGSETIPDMFDRVNIIGEIIFVDTESVNFSNGSAIKSWDDGEPYSY